MKQKDPKQEIVSTALQQVKFTDGMIVTAEDLQDASSYPLGVFKTLIRAFFGCGIVCGLEVKRSGDEDKKTWCVDINPGVALDCHGHPLELCKPVKFDLSDAYGCDPKPPTCVCIAIRRHTSDESPRTNSSCSESQSEQEYDCRRVREQVLIKVFDPSDPCKTDERPKNLCMLDVKEVGCCSDEKVDLVDTSGQVDSTTTESSSECLPEKNCKCLKACPCKECCGDSWLLLACIQLDDCGVVCVENRLRKYVKPIACVCPPEEKECVERPQAEEKIIKDETVKPASKKPATNLEQEKSFAASKSVEMEAKVIKTATKKPPAKPRASRAKK